MAGEVVEAAEEIIRKTCKELDIEVIDKPFFRKESFTKEIIFRSIRSLFYLPCLETLPGRISSFPVLTDITNFR